MTHYEQEIDRLNADRDSWRRVAEKLQAENTRLREALQEISRKAVCPFDEYGSLARAALAATEEPTTVK